jgi:proteasome lid subunit RPN8/RPN11
MISLIRRRILVLLVPEHRLSCKRRLWTTILNELALRGRGERESGAFLLGRSVGPRSEIVDVAYYDDLAPDALFGGAIRLAGSTYGVLWQICRERGLRVVADVHTHPGIATQSPTDRDNPMISESGHVALIVPRFAQHPRDDAALGVYEYLGRHRWKRREGVAAQRFFLRTFL